MKRFTLILALVLFPLALFADDAGVTWKMAFLKTIKGKTESVPFSRPLSLADGDQFQILLAPATPAFVDVLYEDTTGAVTVLFQGAVKAGQTVTLPAVGQSFQVSPPKGTEKIHVVVSAKAQTALEAQLKGLPQNSTAALDGLSRLKTALLSIAEAPEKPVPMGGVTRGINDVKVTEFHGSAAYVKTIRFDH